VELVAPVLPHIGPCQALGGVKELGAGIPRESPTGERRMVHSLRHTFAPIALQTGREITWLSKRLGHRTLEITATTYGHWERAARKRQAEKMAGVFGV